MDDSLPRAGAMVVTDLDGTLLDSQGRLSAGNRSTLERLGAMGVVRVVATGRNLFSALRALAPDTPIDYLVFASGAGTLCWTTRNLLHACHLDDEQALAAARHLVELGLDFMLHAGVPDNHRFWYHRTRRDNADFERRLDRYLDHAVPWPDAAPSGPFSQLLAVQAPGCPVTQQTLGEALHPLNVIRATSPLDHRSFWYEVFAEGVSKATGAARLLERHGIGQEHVLALGNDYNDEALLAWAPYPAVVANAPPELLQRYPAVAANDDDGFSDAVRGWLGSLGLTA